MTMTSLDLDRSLVEAAKRATGQTTARGAVSAALRQVVDRAEQVAALEALAGMEHLSDLLDPEVADRAAE